MKIKFLKDDRDYSIINGECLEIFDKLPNKTFVYKVVKTMMGVNRYLEETEDFSIKEKIYGNNKSKVEKFFKTFKKFDRNLGVILSGKKGIGKSVCAKLIAEEGIKQQYPVIVINDYDDGLTEFLDTIKQECIVIFDEFDKTFGTANKRNDGYDYPMEDDGEIPHDKKETNSSKQTKLLSLFDGFSNNKKMYVITCNDINSISSFFVNRPGRFHYHIRFKTLGSSEIKEYLTDKLEKQYHNIINQVVVFSKKFELNYDCLRAIAFEINNGNNFEETINDLNIVNMNDSSRYKGLVTFTNGMSAYTDAEWINMFSRDGEPWMSVTLGEYKGKEIEFAFRYRIQDIKADDETGELYLVNKDICGNYFRNISTGNKINDNDQKILSNKFKIKRIVLERVNIDAYKNLLV